LVLVRLGNGDDVSGLGMEKPIERVIEPVAFYGGAAALLVLSSVIALYFAQAIFK